MALTGFIVNQGAGNLTICAPDSTSAINALGSLFPVVAGNNPNFCTLDGATFTSPNVFNVSVLCHDLTSNNDWLKAHPIMLPRCDPALDPNVFLSPTPENILYVFTWGFGAVVFFFFLGFVIGMASGVIKKA